MNKECYYCGDKIPYSENIPENIILFCDLDCYGNRCRDDE